MASDSLAARLRDGTAALHRRAERTGFVRALLTGQADRAGLAQLLRNLLPVYEALEAGLEQHRSSPLLGALARPALYRAPALRADLATLGGTPTLLPEGTAYAASVAASAEGDGASLLAFAYVRYLGDLSGGQMLNRLLGKSLGVASLAFYTFADIEDPSAFKNELREAIDHAGQMMAAPEMVLETAIRAFELDIALSEAIGSK